MVLNCPKNPDHLSQKVNAVGFSLPAVVLVNRTVLTKTNVPFLKYCMERSEKLTLETVYFIVLFSVTNKTVNVKEEFC